MSNTFNPIVKRQIIQQYISLYGSDRKGDVWCLQSVIDVFRYFYDYYYSVFGEVHPRLSNNTIRNIIERLPYACESEESKYSEDTGSVLFESRHPLEDGVELEPDLYYEMIASYFEQPFQRCNYSIAHFMSDNIRILRFYELYY